MCERATYCALFTIHDKLVLGGSMVLHNDCSYFQLGWVYTKGHFTHEIESPRPVHFKHSNWWERRSRSKFATSHYAWGTIGVCECTMDVTSTWIPMWH